MADKHVIVKLESYDGDDTHLHCGDDHQDFLDCIVTIDEQRNAEIVDNGYRSYGEAATTWPEACASLPAPKFFPSSASRRSGALRPSTIEGVVSEIVAAIEHRDYVEARLALKNLADDVVGSAQPNVRVPAGALELLLIQLLDSLPK
jgi:hypothetical protein